LDGVLSVLIELLQLIRIPALGVSIILRTSVVSVKRVLSTTE